MRDPAFMQALRSWLTERGYLTLTIPESALSAWHALCDMEMDPAERFVLGAGLRQMPENEIALWQSSLQKIADEESSTKIAKPKSKAKK